MRTIRMVLAAILAVALIGCDYKIVDERSSLQPSPIVTTTPTPTPPPVVVDLVEFRVTGDLSSAIVRVSNSLDGLSQINSALPFSQMLSISGRDSVFLSVDARGTGAGFLHAAIFVNGYVFREASSQSLIFNPFIGVSGTWRRGQ